MAQPEKIILEEHFALPDTVNDSEQYFASDVWPKMRHQLVDLDDSRMAEMDRCGIEIMLLSLNAPAVQAVPTVRKAIELARQANDYLAEQVAKHQDRFQALAALPMQDPGEAAQELVRCVGSYQNDARTSAAASIRPSISRSRLHLRTGRRTWGEHDTTGKCDVEIWPAPAHDADLFHHLEHAAAGGLGQQLFTHVAHGAFLHFSA